MHLREAEGIHGSLKYNCQFREKSSPENCEFRLLQPKIGKVKIISIKYKDSLNNFSKFEKTLRRHLIYKRLFGQLSVNALMMQAR